MPVPRSPHKRRTRPMLRTAKRSSQHKSPLVPAITATTQKTGPRSLEKHALTENHNSYSKTHAFRRRNPLFHNRRSPLKKSHISAGFRQCSHHASHNHMSSQQQSPASQRQSTLESAAIPNLVFPILAIPSQQLLKSPISHSHTPTHFTRLPIHMHTTVTPGNHRKGDL